MVQEEEESPFVGQLEHFHAFYFENQHPCYYFHENCFHLPGEDPARWSVVIVSKVTSEELPSELSIAGECFAQIHTTALFSSYTPSASGGGRGAKRLDAFN
jgi:hypothetical protein